MISFLHPERLWLLAALPLLALGLRRAGRRRRRDWTALGQSGRMRPEAAWSWLAALACLIVAVAQPRWGRLPGAGLPPGHDVVLLIDVSRSMAAEDAVPDRLGSVVEAADGLIRALASEPGNQVAVVEFAGRAVVRLPLTEGLDAALELLPRLRPGEVQPGGTDLGAALAAALDAFGEEDHAEGRSVVLFTDGEDHAGRWPDWLERLKAAGVVVHAVAVGDAEQGAKVPAGDGRPLTYHGEAVVSARDDRPLEAIARATGGAFLPLGLSRGDLGRLYRDRIAPVAKRQRESLRLPERAERFGLFVGSALALSLIGAWPGRRGFSLVLASLLLAGAGPSADTAAEAVARGRAAYARGEYAGALADFDRAIALDPNSPIPRYDAAEALHRLGRHAEAADRYRGARERAGPGLRAKIDYALGNTLFALGDIDGALASYDLSLASKVRGASYDLVRSFAADNRRFVAEQRPRPPAESGDEGGRRVPEKRPQGSPRAGAERPDESPGATSKPAPASPGQPPPDAAPAAKGQPSGTPEEAARNPQTPEARLADALDRIRQAHRRRLETPPPETPTSGDRKDW